MKASYFFGENNLKSFFRPGWKGMGDPGVGGGYMGVLVKLSPYFYLKMLGVYSFKTDR